MSLFELSGVRVAYEGRVVLDLPRLAIDENTAYSLQGPNGAGKSTLLGVISFLSAPHEGEVRFEGEVVRWTEPALRVLRRNVGLVEQHPVMFSRSVRDNVGYGLAIRGVDKALRNRLVGGALDLVGLSHLAAAYAPRLSGAKPSAWPSLALWPVVPRCSSWTSPPPASIRATGSSSNRSWPTCAIGARRRSCSVPITVPRQQRCVLRSSIWKMDALPRARKATPMRGSS